MNTKIKSHICVFVFRLSVVKTHLEVGAEADDALHVCTVVTQYILSTKQGDLVLVHTQLQRTTRRF